ncbi:anti-sigma factor antagonist [bacterium]|nr:anti-sigma factor antagonist [bacterium]
MAGLEWQLKPIDGEDAATLAEMSGAIDGNTVPSFQQMLEEIKSKGVRRLVLDMSKIKYVNSTGLGSLVKYADSFKSSGGGMALIKVPAKVKIVIEMLGLNAFFAICADLPQALTALEKAGTAAPAPAPAASKPPLAANRPPATGTVSRGASGAHPAVSPMGQATPGTGKVGKKGSATFPIVVPCQQCGVQVEFRDSGNWKCPRCYALVSVDGDGSTRFGRSDRPAPITLSLVATTECGEGLLHLVTSVCGTAFNGNNLEAVRIAVHEVASVMQSSIYSGNPDGVYHVAIDRQPGRVTIRVADAGATIEAGRASQYFPNASRQMDEFDCRPHPTGGGNVIRMVKKG